MEACNIFLHPFVVSALMWFGNWSRRKRIVGRLWARKKLRCWRTATNTTWTPNPWTTASSPWRTATRYGSNHCLWHCDTNKGFIVVSFYGLAGVFHTQRCGHADAAAVQRSPQEALPAGSEGRVQRVTTTERLPCPDPPNSGKRCPLPLLLHPKTLSVCPLIWQIQNQLPGAIFPYVFYPVKLPKSITMDSGLWLPVSAGW